MSKCLFNETIINTISNFESNQIYTCDDCGSPRMNEYMKILLLLKIIFNFYLVLTTANMYHHLSFKNLQR